MDQIVDRILYRTRAQISATFVVDGEGQDPSPDTATVRIVRADGSVLLDAPADEAGEGTYAKTLEAAQLPAVDLLTADWTAGDGQVITTHHEVVGGFLLTTAAAETLIPGATASTLRAVRTLAEEALEDLCGAFVPRYALEAYDGNDHRSGRLRLRQRHPRVVRAVTVAGVAYTPEQLAELRITETGAVYNPAGWARGNGNITIGYEHGRDYPPGRVSNAALMLVERWGVEQATAERVVSASVDRVSFRLAVAGKDGEPFDMPEANAVVQTYGPKAVRLV